MNLFDESDLITSYTRRQAIEDGVLLPLSGSDYPAEGDAWLPAMCTEAGFRFPIAVTAEVFFDCIDVHEAAEEALNDIEGRAWDLLYMLANAIRRSQPGQPEILFSVACVVKADSQYRRSRSARKPSTIQLKAVCGPGDDGEPVITVMWPNQD